MIKTIYQWYFILLRDDVFLKPLKLPKPIQKLITVLGSWILFSFIFSSLILLVCEEVFKPFCLIYLVNNINEMLLPIYVREIDFQQFFSQFDIVL